MANQQAAIDTFSSKIHNIELANRQRSCAVHAWLKQLDGENRRLAGELHDCRERESRMRNRLKNRRDDRMQDLERENAALRCQLALLFKAGRKCQTRLSVDTVSTVSTDSASVPHTL